MRTRLLAAALALAGVAAAQPAAAVPVEQPLGPVLVLAHRGASFDAPEHTRPAYDKAMRDGTDFLECDLQLTKDGVLVCIHDTTVVTSVRVLSVPLADDDTGEGALLVLAATRPAAARLAAAAVTGRLSVVVHGR